MNDDTPSAGKDRFRTPDEAAAADNLTETPKAPLPQMLPVAGWQRFFRRPQNRKEWLILAGLVLLLIVILLALFGGSDGEPARQKSKPRTLKTQPSIVPSTLTGLPVKPAVNKRPVTGVMIENSLPARPQSGLSSAGVVFEAIAEAGITRFLALYQDTSANVGPVRSARPYYIHWLMGFDANYAHVGGSPDALASIRRWHVRDLDQFSNPGYRRISSRSAPHNVYSNVDHLIAAAKSRGYKESNFKSFVRKKEKPAKKPTAKVIEIRFSGAQYNTKYIYSPSGNKYARMLAGGKHIDANNSRQIHPKVIVALVMTYRVAPDGYHSIYYSLGKGKAVIFQDGVMQEGQWIKSAKEKQIQLIDAKGKTLKLNAGQTWVTAVGKRADVASRP